MKNTYVALLRGINVGGNNKVSMAELRICLEGLNLTKVCTYINSGNIIFQTSEKSIDKISKLIEKSIKKAFGFDIRVIVLSFDQIKTIVQSAPASWGDNVEFKHNALFVRPPKTSQDAFKQMGKPKAGTEIVSPGEGVIYWSSSLKEFGKTASSKLASKPIYQEVTVRNYNTTQKLYELMEQVQSGE